MISRDNAANTNPTVECCAWAAPKSDHTASRLTYAANAKKDTAMTLSAVRSRAS